MGSMEKGKLDNEDGMSDLAGSIDRAERAIIYNIVSHNLGRGAPHCKVAPDMFDALRSASNALPRLRSEGYDGECNKIVSVA